MTNTPPPELSETVSALLEKADPSFPPPVVERAELEKMLDSKLENKSFPGERTARKVMLSYLEAFSLIQSMQAHMQESSKDMDEKRSSSGKHVERLAAPEQQKMQALESLCTTLEDYMLSQTALEQAYILRNAFSVSFVSMYLEAWAKFAQSLWEGQTGQHVDLQDSLLADNKKSSWEALRSQPQQILQRAEEQADALNQMAAPQQTGAGR